MRFILEGSGCYLPNNIVKSAFLENKMGLEAGFIEENYGVAQRHWADGKTETNASMGAEACKAALLAAGKNLGDIDLILNASGTVQQLVPDNAPLIQRALGAEAAGIPAFSVHATCLSFLMGLDVAASFLALKKYKRILLVTSDTGSLAINFSQPESASLVGDGAAAFLLCSQDAEDSKEGALKFEVLGSRMQTYGEYSHTTEVRGGGSWLPSYERTEENASDYLFDMDGRHVLLAALRHVPALIKLLMSDTGLSIADINWVVPHQASKLGLKLASHIGFKPEQVGVTLPHLGNMVAASIPLTFYEMLEKNTFKSGDRIMLIGTGAGLSIAGMVVQIS